MREVTTRAQGAREGSRRFLHKRAVKGVLFPFHLFEDGLGVTSCQSLELVKV